MVTRSLVIDFIRYLRNKENVIIDPYITRTMFKPNVDRTDTIIKLLEKIKKAVKAIPVIKYFFAFSLSSFGFEHLL